MPLVEARVLDSVRRSTVGANATGGSPSREADVLLTK